MAVSINTSIPVDGPANSAQGDLEPFLQAAFDPAVYLNNALPSLSTSSTTRISHTSQYGRAVSLPELSSQSQTLLAQLNAQTSRLSSTLAQLTDEIVRSGGRLAYEVDVLRGETIGLTDSLQGALKNDVELFTLSLDESVPTADRQIGNGPEYLDRLKTLALVRARLDAVVQVFGEAMEWPLAPSELSMASSLISVAAPDSGDASRSREEKGKAYAEQKRREITEMIASVNDVADLDAATAAIQDLRLLTEVWKGTSEEKARLRFVDSLQKLVDEKQKGIGRFGSSRPSTVPARGMDYRYGEMGSTRAGTDTPLGFLQNLRGLKNDV